MARTYGQFDPEIPLGTTWEESFRMRDRAGTAIDLTGYAARAQFRVQDTVRLISGVGMADPVFELTTPGFYSILPAWPVEEALSIPTPTDGTILLRMESLWLASPTNIRARLRYSLKLVGAADYTLPVVNGVAMFLPDTTI